MLIIFSLSHAPSLYLVMSWVFNFLITFSRNHLSGKQRIMNFRKWISYSLVLCNRRVTPGKPQTPVPLFFRHCFWESCISARQFLLPSLLSGLIFWHCSTSVAYKRTVPFKTGWFQSLSTCCNLGATFSSQPMSSSPVFCSEAFHLYVIQSPCHN